MAKNFANQYNSTNDAIALEQKYFIKEEATRGVLEAPAGTDFLYTLAGGSASLTQAKNSSPHRSGRHHTGFIKEKKVVEWGLPTFVNIDTSVGVGTSEVDLAVRTLHKSMWGKEDTTSGVVYTSADAPAITFSLLENGDKWAKQVAGAFVQTATLSFPGDGNSQIEWGGAAKSLKFVGIGKSTVDNDAGNTITVETGEGKRFPVGALVMILEADGTTRSADTPDGSPRVVTDQTGDVITVDGAVLADANGATAEIYLAYYEPETPVAINEPITGLVGSVSIDNLPGGPCVRTITVTCNNNHEVVDYCFGEDELSGKLFVPGDRLTCEVSLELNLNHELLEYLNDKLDFVADDIDIVLGDVTGRHLKLDLPQVRYNVPEVSVPETGSIPVTFEGMAEQTTLDAADEITVSYL